MPRFLHTDTHPNSLGWPGHSEWMIVNPHLSSSSRVLAVEIERDEVMLGKQSQKQFMIRKQASNKQEYVPSNSDLPTLTHRCKEWKETHVSCS